MTDLTAIDILIDPDPTMLARARAVNAAMLARLPAGFALDGHHQPHVTILQRYVRSADLAGMYDAVGSAVGPVDLVALPLRATGIRQIAAAGGVGLAGIVVRASPEVLELQARLIDAVAPFVASGGTAEAFVGTAAEPEINQATIDYVERYVPEHSGASYVGHVTVGLVPLDEMGAVEVEPFEELTFHPVGLSIYRLGNNGTAAGRLRSWTA
ncbi:hypothetical protein [Promicromonospora sp. NPDC059942]|uniref:hypothetical protein n=1 Tax=Promicromonospora sp. NPDC059942 TaxID=3347009 RepID=UPI00364F561C